MLAAPHALTDRRPSLGALVVANFVPAVGVVWFGWSALSVVRLYWLEAGVIGAVGVARMALVQDESSAGVRATMVGLFVVAYGLVWDGLRTVVGEMVGAPKLELTPALSAGLVPLVVSHATSFVTTYLRRERAGATLSNEFVLPFARVMLPIAAYVGGSVLLALGASQVWGVLLLIGLKTVLDAGLHLYGHRLYQRRIAGAHAAGRRTVGDARRAASRSGADHPGARLP